MMENLNFAAFQFPCNPESCCLSFHRDYTVKATDNGQWQADKGVRLARRLECKGWFCGYNAYDSFKELAALFMNGTIGTLTHPKWEAFPAFIGELEVLEEPQENLLQYRILFIETTN